MLNPVVVMILVASRVLQALARDNLLPLRWMAHGSGPGDEPRRALVATWLLMQACLFVPTLNLLSTYSSMFLLQAWAFVNIACLVLSVTGTHNWRPSFKLFSWHTALAGSLMCAAAMFLTDYMAALISMGIVLILFGYVHWFRKPQTSWGDVMQAIMYHQVCNAHRFVVLLTDDRSESIFCAWILRRTTLSIGVHRFCCARIIQAETTDCCKCATVSRR